MPTPITRAEAAALLGGAAGPVNERIVRRLARRGLIPSYGRGDDWRTFRESIEEYQQRLASGAVVWPPERNKGRTPRSPVRTGGRAVAPTDTSIYTDTPMTAMPPKRRPPTDTSISTDTPLTDTPVKRRPPKA